MAYVNNPDMYIFSFFLLLHISYAPIMLKMLSGMILGTVIVEAVARVSTCPPFVGMTHP